MWPEFHLHYHHHHLVPESPLKLRPTQMSVGLAEVAAKRREWAKLGDKQRHKQLRRQVFPAVLGPGKRCFILDHHHLGLALIEEGISRVWVALQDDLSWLAADVFWRTMEFRAWAHPFDERGVRHDCGDIPARLTQLQDDPYRTLANRVHEAGGYAKSATPFAEFLWADFLRARIGLGAARRGSPQAVRTGVRLARSGAARYLPGWSGRRS
jgi:hypothetical protein